MPREDEEVDEVDLEELQNFLGRSTLPPAGVVAAAAAPGDPWDQGADPWGKSALQAADPPLPPGFEEGPHTGSHSGQQSRRPPPAAGGSAGGGLVGEASGTVVVEQEDPTAPYLAATSWDELNLPQAVLDGIYDMGFVRPSKIQEWALPIALKGGNIIGQAQNGSGKTAAFSLAMLLRCDAAQAWPQAICICPTRELAQQNYAVTEKLGKFTSLKLFLAVPQEARPPKKVEAQVICGTPGKLQDLMRKRVIDARWAAIFVVDEADVMVNEDQQMGPQVAAVRAMLPTDVQVLLFSATWPDHVEQFARQMVPKANTVKVQKEDLTLATITQTYILVEADRQKKAAQLSDLYGALNVGQSIIFVNTRTMAFELAKMMRAEGHAVSLICGTQKSGTEVVDIGYRDAVMAEFRSGVTKVLISTDVLARGIDVPAVTLVVNFDLPLAYRQRGEVETETYMHRIGRTGRFGLRGVAVNFVTQQELSMITSIERFYQCSIKKLSGDCEEMETLLRSLR